MKLQPINPAKQCEFKGREQLLVINPKKIIGSGMARDNKPWTFTRLDLIKQFAQYLFVGNRKVLVSEHVLNGKLVDMYIGEKALARQRKNYDLF
ncbi:MAG: hypothetical protein WCG95_03980 [bacterium]